MASSSVKIFFSDFSGSVCGILTNRNPTRKGAWIIDSGLGASKAARSSALYEHTQNSEPFFRHLIVLTKADAIRKPRVDPGPSQKKIRLILAIVF